MAVKVYKPTSAGRRIHSVTDYSVLHKKHKTPKSLLVSKKTQAGRNHSGKITVRQAFEHSSNVAMAKLVDKHFKTRAQKFVDHVERLKLNKPLGIQISGEPEPKFKRPGEKGYPLK